MYMGQSETLSHLRIEGTAKFMTNLLHMLLTDSIVILVKSYPQCAPTSAPTKYPPSTTQLLPKYYLTTQVF